MLTAQQMPLGTSTWFNIRCKICWVNFASMDWPLVKKQKYWKHGQLPQWIPGTAKPYRMGWLKPHPFCEKLHFNIEKFSFRSSGGPFETRIIVMSLNTLAKGNVARFWKACLVSDCLKNRLRQKVLRFRKKTMNIREAMSLYICLEVLRKKEKTKLSRISSVFFFKFQTNLKHIRAQQGQIL